MEDFSEIAFVKLVAAGMLLAFVLAASIVVFVLIYQRKLAKQVMEMQGLKIEHQEKLIQSSIQVAENERKQFASNLHDVIGAQVAIAKITLSSVESEYKENQTTINKSLEILDEISTSIRSISYDIVPPVLIKLGLSKAVEDYLKKLPETGVKTKLESSIGTRRFSSNSELHAFRICQEAITNAMKHADCSSIRIVLNASSDSSFSLVISDNGVGMKQDVKSGIGLLNMEHRAKLIGLDMEVQSDDSGTTVSLQPQKQVT